MLHGHQTSRPAPGGAHLASDLTQPQRDTSNGSGNSIQPPFGTSGVLAGTHYPDWFSIALWLMHKSLSHTKVPVSHWLQLKHYIRLTQVEESMDPLGGWDCHTRGSANAAASLQHGEGFRITFLAPEPPQAGLSAAGWPRWLGWVASMGKGHEHQACDEMCVFTFSE